MDDEGSGMYFYFEDDSQISFSITDGEVNFAKVGTHDSEGAGDKQNENLDIKKQCGKSCNQDFPHCSMFS